MWVETGIVRRMALLGIWTVLFASNVTETLPQKVTLIVQAGHSDRIVDGAYSLDGKLFATGGAMRIVKVWETETGLLLKTLDASEFHVDDDEFWPLSYKLAFSRDGRLLAVSYGAEDATLVWDISKGQAVDSACTGAEALAFTPDSSTLVAIGSDNSFRPGSSVETPIQLCSVQNGERIAPKRPLGHYWNLFPPGNRFHSEPAVEGGPIVMSDIISGKVIFTEKMDGGKSSGSSRYSDDPDQHVVSSDGRRVALLGSSVRVYQIRPKRLLARFTHPTSLPAQCDLNDDGRELVCVFEDGSIRTWREGSKSFRELLPGEAAREPQPDELGSVNEIDSFAKRSPTTRTVAVGSKSHCPRFVSFEDPTRQVSFEMASPEIHSLEFVLNENAIAFGAGENYGVFSFSGTRESLGKVPFQPGYSARHRRQPVIYSSERNTALIMRDEKNADLWDFESKSIVGRPSTEEQSQFAAKNKSTVAAVIPNADLTFFDGSNLIGICWTTFENGRTGRSFKVGMCDTRYSVDGTKIIGKTEDGNIKIIDRESRELVTIIPRGESDWIVIAPDGRFDTNLALDQIRGVHWILSDDPFKPEPIELFMRQYFEPGLLDRILKCGAEMEADGTDSCDKEFKPLPPIQAINRVQPRAGSPIVRLSEPSWARP